MRIPTDIESYACLAENCFARFCVPCSEVYLNNGSECRGLNYTRYPNTALWVCKSNARAGETLIYGLECEPAG